MTDRRRTAILAMAQRGTEHEKRMAQELAEKHGIEGEIDEPDYHFFSYRTKFEERLLHQVVAVVMNDMKNAYYSYPGKKRSIGFKVTNRQSAEIDLYYSVLKREMHDEFNLCFFAFVEANMLYPACNLEAPGKDIPDNAEDILKRAENIKRATIRKQLSI